MYSFIFGISDFLNYEIHMEILWKLLFHIYIYNLDIILWISQIYIIRNYVKYLIYQKLNSLLFLFFFLLIYLFLAVLGLRFCARAFSSCGERGPLFIAVRGPLTIAASLVAEQRLQTRRLSSCGSRAQLLRGMWDLPRPGLEPVSPALAGRFSTTAPPGKPSLPF